MAHPTVPPTLEPAPLSVGDRRRLIRSVFEEHYERVYFFLVRRIPTEQAEDLVQEVFFRLLKHRKLETIEITASYLFKIAENLIKNNYKRDSRRRELAGELHETERVRHLDAGLTDSDFVLDRAILDQVMAELTANERAAITLIVCQGLSYEAASMALGVNVTTINNWKHRGVQKLKRQVQERSSCVADASGCNQTSPDSAPHRGGSKQTSRASTPRCPTQGSPTNQGTLGNVG